MSVRASVERAERLTENVRRQADCAPVQPGAPTGQLGLWPSTPLTSTHLSKRHPRRTRATFQTRIGSPSRPRHNPFFVQRTRAKTAKSRPLVISPQPLFPINGPSALVRQALLHRTTLIVDRLLSLQIPVSRLDVPHTEGRSETQQLGFLPPGRQTLVVDTQRPCPPPAVKFGMHVPGKWSQGGLDRRWG